MRLQGKRLGNFRVTQPAGVVDQVLISASAYRVCKGREECTGETLSGCVPMWAIVDWAAAQGFLTWRDDPQHRSPLQEIRR